MASIASTGDTGDRFAWLHLSDLHAGRSAHAYLWPNVQEVVLDDLRKLHERSGPWHAVFFTGDLSQSGDPEQFELVAEFRDVLRGQLEELGSSPTFISTPGNHDVARPDPHSPLVAHAHLVPNDAERREHLFVADDDEFRDSLTGIFRAWLDWHQANEVPGIEEYRAGVLPGDYSATLIVGGRRVGVVALNTAALQLDDTPAEKRVTLHAAQLAAVCPGGGGAWAAGHDAAFLLTHHPPEWLDARGYDALRTEIAPPGRFLLHLYGHQHEPRNYSFSFGGGIPRHEALGRSLFGLEHWGQANETRLHGYSAGEVWFVPTPSIRLWPRAAVVRHGGGWQIVADPGEPTDDGGALELNAAALESVPASALASTSTEEAVATGWREVTRASLDEEQESLSPELLKHYFDGAQPDWRHAQSDSIPRREVVADVLDDLARAAEIKLPRIVLLVGPTGEGKSTVLRQVVAEAVRTGGFRALWRDDPETPLVPDELLALPAGPWIVATDDADSIAADAFRSWNRLLLNHRQDVFLVLAARDTDWRRAGGDDLAWEGWLDERRIRGLRNRDAVAIVRAWAAGGALTLGELAKVDDEDERVRRVLEAAGSGPRRERSLLGAALRTRHTPAGLRQHVHELLVRLEQHEGKTGVTLAHVFVAVAALDGVGVEGIHRRVLADVFQLPHDSVWSGVVRPLADEAAATRAGHLIQTRHPAIAEAALAIVEDTGRPVDLRELYPRIVAAAVEAGKTDTLEFVEGWHGSVVHLGPRLVRRLPSSVSESSRAAIAVAAAEAAATQEPERLSFRVTLARTWRATGGFAEASAVLRDALSVAEVAVDRTTDIRGFWLEWGTVAGCRHDYRTNLVAAGLSLSDFLNPVPVTEDDLSYLVNIGAPLLELVSGGEEVFVRGLGAMSALGTLLPQLRDRPQLEGFLQRHRAGAAQVSAPIPPDVETALDWIAEAVNAARVGLEDTSGAAVLADAPALGFDALRARVLAS